MFKQTYYSEKPSRGSEVSWSTNYELENNGCKNFSVEINYGGGVAPFYTLRQGSYYCHIYPVHVEELIKLLSLTYKDKTGDFTRNLKSNETLESSLHIETNGTV